MTRGKNGNWKGKVSGLTKAFDSDDRKLFHVSNLRLTMKSSGCGLASLGVGETKIFSKTCHKYIII